MNVAKLMMEKGPNVFLVKSYAKIQDKHLIKPRGGGDTEGCAPALRISRNMGSFFKTSACLRFCKRRVLFCTQVRSMGVKIPLQSTKYTRL